MNQGKKEVKNTKVPKSLLKQKKGVMTDLMKQLDEDDESSSDNKDNQIRNIGNKVKDVNIDYGMLDDYVPNYTQSQREKKEEKNEKIIIEQLDENIDIEADDKPIKHKTIKREKKVLADDSAGNTIRNRSAIKRMIKQQEEIDNNLNLFSKSNQKSNFTRTIKDITMSDNMENKDNTYSFMSFNKAKYNLPIEKDNTIKVFWYDAIEEMFNNKPNVIFFGKIYEPNSKSYLL